MGRPTIVMWPSRREVSLLHPRAEDLELADVAYALSCQCRFGGRVPVFYSVAEHSLLVESVAGDQWTPVERLSFLMHDAQEAYLGDVVRPLKELLPEYRRLEEVWAGVVRERFSLPWNEEVRTAVKEADDLVNRAERECFFRGRADSRGAWILSLGDGRCSSVGMCAASAELEFARRFKELVREASCA